MRRLIALTQIILLTSIFPGLTLAQQPNQQIGNITGVVLEKKQEDGDESLSSDIKSDVPIDKVEWKLSNRLIDQVKTIALPDNWSEQRIDQTLLLTGPPKFNLKIGLEIPKDYVQDLKKVIKDGLNYNCSFGSTNYGVRHFEVKLADLAKLVNPNDAADIPEVIRVGQAFTIKAKDGFTDGIWKIKLGDKFFEEYRGSYPDIDLKKLNQIVNDPQFLSGAKSIGQDYDKLFNHDSLLVNGNADTPNRTFFIPDGTPVPPDLKIGVTFDNYFGERKVNGLANTKVLPDFSDFSDTFALPPPRLIDCSPKVFQGDKLCVCGFFPNLAYANKLLLDGKSPFGIAESSSTDMATFSTRELAPGKHTLTWNLEYLSDNLNPDPDRRLPSADEKVEFTVIKLIGSIDQNKLFTGQGTTMRIDIVGTDEKVPIELTNATPDVIDLEGGVSQIATTSGGDKNNGFTRAVKGIKRGSFNIQYKLTLPPCPCNPAETEKAAQNIGGAVQNTNPQPPKEQPKERSDNCEQLLAGCQEIAAQLARLQQDYQTALKYGQSEASSLSGAEREAAVKRIKEDAARIYEPAIAEAQKKLAACLKLFNACKFRKSMEGPTSVAPPPLDDPKEPEKPEPCDEIKKECEGLKAAFDNLAKEQTKELDACQGSGPALQECLDKVAKKYKQLGEEIQNKLKDCRARLANCQTGGSPPPKEPEKPVDCDDLRREYERLDKSMGVLRAELDIAIKGASKFESDPVRLKNQIDIVKSIFFPKLEAAKKKQDEIKEKINKNCNK